MTQLLFVLSTAKIEIDKSEFVEEIVWHIVVWIAAKIAAKQRSAVGAKSVAVTIGDETYL